MASPYVGRRENMIESRARYQGKPRRHRLQMTGLEIAALDATVRALTLTPFSIGKHTLDRMAEKNISRADVTLAIQQGRCFEVNDNGANGLNICLRYDGEIKSTIVVLSLLSRTVVTTYTNGRGDSHRTIALGEYRWQTNAANETAKYLGRVQ